jgi:hypothetical protein
MVLPTLCRGVMRGAMNRMSNLLAVGVIFALAVSIRIGRTKRLLAEFNVFVIIGRVSLCAVLIML